MAKFITVVGIALIGIVLTALLWPKFTASPRPEPLARIHGFILSTPAGQNAANVLGVSDEFSIVPLTPQSISQQVVTSLRSRVSDVLITHAVRTITDRFKDLPLEEQEKVINAFAEGISETQQEPSSTAEEVPPSSEQTSQ